MAGASSDFLNAVKRYAVMLLDDADIIGELGSGGGSASGSSNQLRGAANP